MAGAHLSVRLLRWAFQGLAVVVLAGACGNPSWEDAVVATVRWHLEVEARGGGGVRPVVLGFERRVGLCFELPAEVDSSRWEAELQFGGRPSPAGLEPITSRSGGTVCFDALPPEDLAASEEMPLCARVVDRFDGRALRLPCGVVRFEPDPVGYRQQEEALDELLHAHQDGGLEPLLRGLDRLAIANAERFPVLALRTHLIAAHYLTQEGTTTGLEEARLRLVALPSWLNEGGAEVWLAQASHQRALFYLHAERDLAAAWRELRAADLAYRRIAGGSRLAVVSQQAAILARAGAGDEALRRLREALADCQRLACRSDLVSYGRGQLAWLILLDPESSTESLDEAERSLGAGLASLDPRREPLEVANQQLELAYLRILQGQDPSSALAAADRLFVQMGASGDTARQLPRWGELIRALGHLAGGDAASAEAGCAALSTVAEPQIAVWAWNCVGQARYARGRFGAALEAFQEGMLRHELMDLPEVGKGLPLGPGQRALTFARAARAAADGGEPERAWLILRRLDRRSAHEGERRRCREQARVPELVARWDEIDARRAQGLTELASLEVPAAGARRRELEIRRREVRQSLRELWWEWPGCQSMPEAEVDGVDFRAFAVDDEILLLRRRGESGAELDHRTSIPLAARRRLLGRVSRALDGGGAPAAAGVTREQAEEAWRELLEPFSAALLPTDLRTLGPVTRFALHGALQVVPPAALPVAGRQSERWLGSITTAVVVPAGAMPRTSVESRQAAPRSPLFVVDPRGDLPGARKLASVYSALFPHARVMRGDMASREAFRDAMPSASWLHVDSHGLYDRVIPELSGLVMADEPVRLMELADLEARWWLVNLSGCRTGRWPTTADSGRYGLGGLLTRAGAEWVIASRTDLEDNVAGDFNLAFYRALSDGASVPSAYRAALAEVGLRYSPASWGGIMLLGGGKTRSGATPLEDRRRMMSGVARADSRRGEP